MGTTTAKSRATETLTLLARRKSKGLTAKELDFMASWEPNHGLTSGALSRLHQRGLIDRLTEKREGFKVYVLPEYVKGRMTEKQGRAKSECSNPECQALETMYEYQVNQNAHLKAVLDSRGISYA